MKCPDYTLSDNQRQFVYDAERCGLTVNYGYSGRGMYGRCCPAVVVDGAGEFYTDAAYASDNMGKGMVLYATS